MAATGSKEWRSCWSSSRTPTWRSQPTAITASTSRRWRRDLRKRTRRKSCNRKNPPSTGHARCLASITRYSGGKPVNYDPRERFIAEFMEKRGDYNIFHAFYRELVQALYETGASRYVFCVNVDAVIAALLLAV